MNEELEKLNQAPSAVAEAGFRDCCGSRAWARRMTEWRPFKNVAEMIEKAENIWQSLGAADWLEAFAAHPKIGERRPGPKQPDRSAKWSRGEQSGTSRASDSVLEELAEKNRLYEEKFGYIFIVCATGKSAEEMLEICRGRLENSPDVELHIAAGEQKKITEIRLKKLLNLENV